MADRRLVAYLGVLLVVCLALAAFVVQSGLIYQFVQPSPDEYERVTVTAYDENGTRLATVEVRVADTDPKRYLGLSATERLAPDEGMLFVHAEEGQYDYVMRNMSFPIDIVHIGANERVNAIHHAQVPDGRPEKSYSGRAKYVLEVPYGWTNRTGLDVGDRVAIPAAAEEPSG